MTKLYITIDTEYSAGDFQRWGPSAQVACFARSILGQTHRGAAGIGYQMDVLDRHGLKAVFFVDPMPALVWGEQAVADVVGPIVARGHDVQLHMHTEWLAFAGSANPLGGRAGGNLRDFSLDDQGRLLDYARRMLIAAGAPPPVAFRAGNYGANDDSLRALATLGMRFDSSHCPGMATSDSRISLDRNDRQPVACCGVTEVPVGCIEGPHGSLRHFQLTALSAGEIIAALRHVQRQRQASMTLVSHSFELLSRDKQRINRVVKHRFECVCAALETLPGVSTATYAGDPPVAIDHGGDFRALPYHALRTWRRRAEQALGNALYGAR